MLTDQYLDVLPNELLDIYEAYTQSVINDIARRLNKMGGNVTSTAAWQMQRLVESGKVYENALKEIAKLTNQSETELKRLFEKAGVKSLAFDDNIYRLAGLKPIPLNLSPAMFDVMRQGLIKTNNTMQNLTRTTALSAQESFIKAADLAYMQVAHGAMSYDQAIRAAIKQTAAAGLQVIYPSGHRDQLDVAMRRATLTGVQQTTAALQMTRADQMNQDLVQISAHRGARPTHALWQGHIFSRSGKDGRYPDLVASTGYGSGDGLCGWNCRHSMYPFFAGISENAYKQADIDKMNARTVKLGGKDVDQYTASQVQRGLERKVRFYKREAGALGAVGKDNTVALSNVARYQAKLRAFVKETKLIRQPAREGPRIKRVQIKPPPAPKAPPPRKPAPIPPAPYVPPKESLNIPKAEVKESSARISTDGTKIRHNERKLESGAFTSARVTIDGNGDAILKTNTQHSGWGDFDLTDGFAKREVMAYDLDQALGLNIVPRTTPFIENGKYLSLQRWVDDADVGAYVQGSNRLADLTEPGKMTLLDMITGNRDRHGNNWLLTKSGHVVAIDNGLAMVSTQQIERLRDVTYMITKQFNKFWSSSWRSKNGQFLLPSQYRDKLQALLKSGELKKILSAADSTDPIANRDLVNAAIARARLIVKAWDTFFVDP